MEVLYGGMEVWSRRKYLIPRVFCAAQHMKKNVRVTNKELAICTEIRRLLVQFMLLGTISCFDGTLSSRLKALWDETDSKCVVSKSSRSPISCFLFYFFLFQHAVASKAKLRSWGSPQPTRTKFRTCRWDRSLGCLSMPIASPCHQSHEKDLSRASLQRSFISTKSSSSRYRLETFVFTFLCLDRTSFVKVLLSERSQFES